MTIHNCSRTRAEAIYRQTICNVMPDKFASKRFGFYTRKMNDYIMEHDDFYLDIDEWFAQLSPGQRDEYMQSYERLRSGESAKNVYKMHVKVDEKVIINYEKLKVKCRTITAQHTDAKVLCGMVAWYVAKLIKKVFPYYDSGRTNEERCKRFERYVQDESYRFVCVDGSGFDKHQHKIHKENVDTDLYTKFVDNHPEIDNWLPRWLVKQFLCDHRMEIIQKGIHYIVFGTVASGHMSTTVMNTLRSIYYAIYPADSAGIPRDEATFNAAINGDDQIVVLIEFYVELYIQTADKLI